MVTNATAQAAVAVDEVGEDSGLLTDKAALPVTQIRLGDLNGAHEEGYHTLGKLKCHGTT